MSTGFYYRMLEQEPVTAPESSTIGKEVTMSTQIVPEISRQLAQAYDTTQRELAKDPAMTGQVWAEALQQLQDFDPREATREQFVQAQASVSILEQVLTSVPYRLGMFDGNK